MVNRVTLARPYARAVFKEASAAERQSWEELLAMLSALVADAQMARLLRDPRVGAERLATMIRELCGARVQDDRQVRYIDLLLETKRMEYAPEIYRQFKELRQRAEHKVAARAVSAYPLDTAGQGRISKLLEQYLGSRVELAVEEDRSLLGGLCIYLGDTVIDASARGRLRRLADVLHAHA